MEKKVYQDAKSFTVKRSTWLRGRPEISTLRNMNGHMCCLGFYAESCGIPPNLFTNRLGPSTLVFSDLLDWATILLNVDKLLTIPCIALMRINDANNLSDQEREKALTIIFKDLGIQVNFVD